jgi:two-component system response regulator
VRSYAILLVEDNPDDVKQALRAFARNNIANEVVVARDGAEALDYLFRDGIQPGLVLLDLKLPRVTGLQVLERIRQDERTRGVPVVILTSSSEAQDVAAGYAAGADNYLRKPVHFASFLTAARSVGLFWTLVESGLALLHPDIGGSTPEDLPAPVATPARALQPRPMEILLGMTDDAACARLASALEADGHVVHQAQAAQGVFGRLVARLSDVVVLDADLPDIGGVDVVRALRGSPRGRGTSCVVLTSDVATCRERLPDAAVHVLDSAVDDAVIVGLVRRIRLAELLRDLAAERLREEPTEVPEDPSRRASGALSGRPAAPAHPWALLDLPVDAAPEAVAHAIQTLTNALEARAAAQPASASARSQASGLAVRLRSVAAELIELHSALRL